MTPNTLIFAARALLGLGVAGIGVLMLGPFAGLEKALMLTDVQAHMMAFYALSLTCFMAFPRTRRGDLALYLLALGALLEIVQSLTGRTMSLSDLAADTVGIGAAMAPGWAERIRSLGRETPWLPLSVAWRYGDRRRARPERQQRPLQAASTTA